jgi:ankyrin repeat protein
MNNNKLISQFYTAIKKRDLATIKKIVGKNKEIVNSPNERGEMPILMIMDNMRYDVLEDDLEILDYLVKCGTDLYAVNEVGTILHEAALFGKIELIKKLLESKIDVNARNNDGKTALHMIVQGAQIGGLCEPKGDLYTSFNLLLEAGADINAKDNNGNIPLHSVINPNDAAFLIAKGADPKVVNNEGKVAFDSSVQLTETYKHELNEIFDEYRTADAYRKKLKENIYFAFFSNKNDFKKYTLEQWQQSIRNNIPDKSADIIIVSPDYWPSEKITSIEQDKLMKKLSNPMFFTNYIEPVLSKHGIQTEIGVNMMTESFVIPFSDHEMVAIVLPYYAKWQ